jgi:hypothetical protein
MTKAKVDIELVYRYFSYIGFINIRRTRKIITSLEFDDTREETESIYLYNLYKKDRFMHEVSRKL